MTERSVDRDALPPGTRLEDFEIDGVIGHGGFGITYRGWNTLLQQVVAIEEYMPAGTAAREADRTVLPRSEEDEKDYLWGLDRFLGEARTLTRFDHPSIVRVQHFFQAHGTGYIVMGHLEKARRWDPSTARARPALTALGRSAVSRVRRSA